MSDSTNHPDPLGRDSRDRAHATPPANARPKGDPDNNTIKAATPPVGAAAGAVAGAAAGIAVPALGPIGARVGAIIGALGGAAAGTAAAGTAAAEGRYTQTDDDRYRALWERLPDRPADRSYETARVAYQYGHLAASHPDFAGAHFADAEPRLRERWPNEFRQQVGEWDAIRAHVEEAFSHARSRGAGQVRDANVIGTAGSAVDPVELARARAGLPSVPEADKRG